MNDFRSDSEVEIAGVKYLLRPTFMGLLEIEARAGCGIIELTRSGSERRFTALQMVGILYGGIIGGLEKGQAVPISWDEFGEACLEHGVNDLIAPAMVFLSKVIMSRKKKQEMTNLQAQPTP